MSGQEKMKLEQAEHRTEIQRLESEIVKEKEAKEKASNNHDESVKARDEANEAAK